MLLPFHRKSATPAFTLVELLVVVAIIAVLAMMLFPVVKRMGEQGRNAKCTNFMRQLGTAALLYAADHEMTLPVTTHQRREGGKSWSITLQEYAGGKVTFRCPCDEDPTRSYSYVINDLLTPNPAGASDLDYSRLSKLESPNTTMLFAEASKDYTNSDHFHFADYVGNKIPIEVFTEQIAVLRHAGSANYVFADAHVETLTLQQVVERLLKPGSRFIDPTAELAP